MADITEATAMELEELLRKLSQTIDTMNGHLNDLGPKASPSMIHALQRHRDILFDYNKEFKKTKVFFSCNFSIFFSIF